MRVEQNKTYRAELHLGYMEQLVNNEVIKKKFEDVGFINVTVIGKGRVRYAIGVWPLPNVDADLPKQVVGVKVQ